MQRILCALAVLMILYRADLQIVICQRNGSGDQICVRQEQFDPGVFQTGDLVGVHIPVGNRAVQEGSFQLCGIRSADQGNRECQVFRPRGRQRVVKRKQGECPGVHCCIGKCR